MSGWGAVYTLLRMTRMRPILKSGSMLLCLVIIKANKVALEHGHSDLSHGRDIDRCLLLDRITIKVLVGGEVDADSTVADQV